MQCNNLSALYYTTGVCISRIIILPLCSIKTNYQINTLSIKETTKDIYHNRGLIGFINSTPYVIISKILTSGMKYYIYNGLKYKYHEDNNKKTIDIKYCMISGLITTVSTTLITHPFEILITRKQANKSGYNNLYTGLPLSLYINFAIYTILFPIYDKLMFETNNILLSSVISSSICTLLVYPYENIRTQISVKSSYKYNYKNIFNKSIWRGFHITNFTHCIGLYITMLSKNYFEKY